MQSTSDSIFFFKKENIISTPKSRLLTPQPALIVQCRVMALAGAGSAGVRLGGYGWVGGVLGLQAVPQAASKSTEKSTLTLQAKASFWPKVGLQRPTREGTTSEPLLSRRTDVRLRRMWGDKGAVAQADSLVPLDSPDFEDAERAEELFGRKWSSGWRPAEARGCFPRRFQVAASAVR